jgi:hypothetical protein
MYDIVMMAQPLEALEYTAVASLTPPCLVSNNDWPAVLH